MAVSLFVLALTSGLLPAQAGNTDDDADLPSDATLIKAASELQHGPLATLPLEVLDLQHRVQVLPTLASVVQHLADLKVYCRDLPIDDTLHNIRCNQTDPHQGVSDFALLTRVDNDRLLVVSVFDSSGESLGGKPALNLVYLAATGSSPPAEVTGEPTAAAPAPATTFLAVIPPPGTPPAKDPTATYPHCLWSYYRNQKVDLGSVAHLNAWTHNHGGQCFMGSASGGAYRIACDTPTGVRGRVHRLLLAGDDDGASCLAVDRLELDGAVLSVPQYQHIFGLDR